MTHVTVTESVLVAAQTAACPINGTFTIDQVYRALPLIRMATGSRALDLEASVRQALQVLRDRGHLHFLDNKGRYRMAERFAA